MKPDPRLCLALFQSRFSALLSPDSNSFLAAAIAAAAAPAISPPRATRVRAPARPSVVRSFFRSSPSSSSRLFYGKEGGSERMDGRYEAAMRASERALLPIGLVATAAVVATACATRCGQCAPIFGFLVQTCCLVFPSSVHSRLTRVKNKALHVLLFFPSDPFLRRFSNRSQ